MTLMTVQKNVHLLKVFPIFNVLSALPVLLALLIIFLTVPFTFSCTRIPVFDTPPHS